MNVEKIIKNKINLESKPYAAIIGGNPSEGARSPQLWNAAFLDHGIDSLMHPFDIDAEDLPHLMEALNLDKLFLGGAISVPHKELVADWLISRGDQYISKEAAAIGAVNSLYRKNGEIFGTNTDGEAALMSLKEECNDLESKNVLLIGPGGAGKAVAAYISQALDAGKLKISSRDSEKIQAFASKIDATVIPWPPQENDLVDADVIVNCTILGSKLFEDSTPLSIEPENDEARVKLIGESAIVFDIIYDPSPTKLLKLSMSRGIQSIDGSKMNLEQAVLAFEYAILNNKGRDNIRRSMLTS
tara:strand:- start:134 stop:1036 length:903 start_codon:yes stop_codon:yes gene_type:complete